MTKRHLALWLALAGVIAAWAPLALAQQGRYEWRDGKWVVATAPAKGTPEGELALIRQELADGNNRSVEGLVKQFIKKYPDSPLVEEAMLRAGLAQLARERYFQAYEWFKRQLDQFPNGRHSERALQKEVEVAEAFLAGKKRIVLAIFYLPARQDGLEIMERVAEQAPGSLIAEVAMIRIAEDHYSHQEYDEAAMAYDHYMELFGKSVRAPEMSLRAAKATYMAYRGLGFDLVPLIEAQQRYTRFNQDYPRQSKDAQVPQMIQQIVSQRAQDDYQTAQYYVRAGQPRAAAYYYRSLMETYPQTSWAKKAEEGLANIGPLPALRPAPTSQPLRQTGSPIPSTAPSTRPAATTEPTSVPATGPTTQTSATGPAATTAPTSNPADVEPINLEDLVPMPDESPASRPATSPASSPATGPASEPATDSAADVSPASWPASSPMPQQQTQQPQQEQQQQDEPVRAPALAGETPTSPTTQPAAPEGRADP